VVVFIHRVTGCPARCVAEPELLPSDLQVARGRHHPVPGRLAAEAEMVTPASSVTHVGMHHAMFLA
jgi:hypothetical protein